MTPFQVLNTTHLNDTQALRSTHLTDPTDNTPDCIMDSIGTTVVSSTITSEPPASSTGLADHTPHLSTTADAPMQSIPLTADPPSLDTGTLPSGPAITEAGTAMTSMVPQGHCMLPPRRRYECKEKMQPVSEPKTKRYVYFSCQSTTYSYCRQFATVDWCTLHPKGTEGNFNQWWDSVQEKSNVMQVGELDCRSTFISLILTSLEVQEEGEGGHQGYARKPPGECNTLCC
jgi:hypothetical protein